MARTAVIILNYNNCSDTAVCIDSLKKHNTAPIRLFVVDNASAPEQKEQLTQMLADKAPDATLILNDKNAGYARGNNLGLEVAYADDDIDRILILNNDIIWTADILPELCHRQDTLADAAIVSPLLFKPGMSEIDANCARMCPSVWDMVKKNMLHYWWRATGNTPEKALKHIYLITTETDFDKVRNLAVELPSGSCMLIKKELMRRIGGFDPNTFLYYEENILYQKLKRLGYVNYVCTDLSCIHVGAATTSTLPNSIFVMRESIKSAKYYLRTYTGYSKVAQWAYALSGTFMLGTFRLQKALSARKAKKS